MTEKIKTDKNSGATPVMQQYLRIKQTYPNEILFFRLGDFYEMFFEDAIRAAPLLEVALTKRQSTPMCGIPHHAASAYISKLIKAGTSVAIAEQLENPKETKGMVKRGVVRVITPGTLVEDELLPSKANNFLVSLVLIPKGKTSSGHWALACADVSTGRQWVGELEDDLNWNTLKAQISLLNPSEILIVGDTPKSNMNLFSAFTCVRYEPVPAGAHGPAAQVVGAIKSYLKRHHEAALESLREPEPLPMESSGMMFLDQTAIRHLELVQGDGPTLVSVLDKTKTPLGSRLLRWWLVHPSINKEEIEERLSQVEKLVDNAQARKDLMEHLKEIPDIERISVRAQSKTVSPRDLGALRHGLKKCPEIKSVLAKLQEETMSNEFCSVQKDLEVPAGLQKILDEQLTENPPAKLIDGNVICTGVNAELDDLRNIKRSGRKWIAEMEAQEREKTGITKLKVGYNNIFGYFLEVSKSFVPKVPPDWIRKQTLVNAERYITPELKAQEEKILGAQDKITILEAALFNDLVRTVVTHVQVLAAISNALARIDTVSSLAQVAAENGYVRPQISDESLLNIKGGRHPVIEKQIGREKFIANDLKMNLDRRVGIITGPNMAGKSTYLRQTALIVIMAQMGSFVPAEEATVGIVDKIFTRIGASDRLSQGQSTFMVEMQEVATLLLNSTEKSLLVLDEVGRGTSTYDGMSIAWAVIESLVPGLKSRGPRTLFATHYFELTQLADQFPGIFNAHATAKEWPGPDGKRQVVFLYQILDGAADRSYGIHVAEMAGLPEGTIERARKILARLESGVHTAEVVQASQTKSSQMDLFSDHPIVTMIREIDMNNMSPMDAFEQLADLKKKI